MIVPPVPLIGLAAVLRATSALLTLSGTQCTVFRLCGCDSNFYAGQWGLCDAGQHWKAQKQRFCPFAQRKFE